MSGVEHPLVVLATGGTGGHIYPATATAKALTARGLRVAFIGQANGLEARIVPAEGFTFYGVRAGKWHRGRPDPREAVRAGLGLTDALVQMRRLRPALVLGFGGFASFPALAAARVLGVPYALHEQNAYPGKVVRWFAGGARFIATTTLEAGAHLSPRTARPAQTKQPTQSTRIEVVGVPVREVRVDKAIARRELGLPERGTLTLVMGGSQGSLVLNKTVPKAFGELSEAQRTDLSVLHSSGPAHLETTQALAAGLPRYRVDGYLDSVLAWSAADLAITRAGNGTLAEAAFHGVPLLMVPLPSAAENHQLHNAHAAEGAGAGLVVEERDLGRLPDAWGRLLEPRTRAAASAAAAKRSPTGAAQRLAALVEETMGQEFWKPNALETR